MEYRANFLVVPARMEAKVLTLCAWCPVYGRQMQVLKEGSSEKGISHGICPDCLKAEQQKFNERKGINQCAA
jgi:hypothetical protein